MTPVSNFWLPIQQGLQHMSAHQVKLMLMLLRCHRGHLWHHNLAVSGQDSRGVWECSLCGIVVLSLYLCSKLLHLLIRQ